MCSIIPQFLTLLPGSRAGIATAKITRNSTQITVTTWALNEYSNNFCVSHTILLMPVVMCITKLSIF